MKIAVFYDWLNQFGGAERVLLNILKIYPDADLYTLVYNPLKARWLPDDIKIFPSLINKLPWSINNPITYTPFYDLALENFNFSQYNIVISTTSTIGHCLLTSPQTLFVTYFHNINRHLYNSPFNFYKKIDYIYSRRPDALLCNSQTVSRRIQDTYHLTPVIINPGIDTNFFKPHSNTKSEYYLVVSRLVEHKQIDIVVNAFKNISDKLVIVGQGRESNNLKNIAKNSTNIKFVDFVTDTQLLNYYQNCRALICPQLEDFGLSALEAQACGKPVIAFGRGGNTETIIDQKTGIFFDDQTSDSLSLAIKHFCEIQFNSRVIQQHALEFSDHRFMLNFKQTIDQLWQKHQTITS